MSLIYEAKDLTKSYNSQLALKIPYFSLEQGAALALTGPNGSGKSTFLRLLAFLETPSSGTLRYLGPGEPHQSCSLLLQEPWLMHASVFQNVVLGLKLRGQRKNLEAIYMETMLAVGFSRPEQFAKRRPGALSGGEKQRIALASRLAINPAVLLLDEPTAYVDAKSGACILNALAASHNQGMTIVCATHDPSLASGLAADRMELCRAEA